MSDIEAKSSSPTTSHEHHKSPRFAAFRFWHLLAVGLVLIATAGLLWPSFWGGSDADGAASSLHSEPKKGDVIPRVEITHPTRGGVRRLTIQPGSIHAYESVDLYAKASGFLKTQSVDIGSKIKRGQLLAEIDAPELLGDVSEAEAAVEQSKAKANQAVLRISTAEAELATAEAALLQAEADIEKLVPKRLLAQKQYDRIKDLYARNAVDGKLVDEHQQDVETAQATERSGHAAAATARALVKTAAAKIQEAKADAAEARAAVRLSEARLERVKVMAAYVRVIAPFDGVITRRSFHPGAFIRSAADGTPEPLVTAMRTDVVRVVIQVPDIDVPLLGIGDKATITLDTIKNKTFEGRVARLGSSEDPTTRTMRVEVDLPNPDGLLVEGMYCRATIELQPPSDNLTVPAASVVGHVGRGAAALFVVRDQKLYRVPVTLGLDDGLSVEVLSGLEPNDLVVVRPANSLEHGAKVQVNNPPTSATSHR